jgi:hypothetical protein
MTEVTAEQVREAAAQKITLRRHELLRERQEIKRAQTHWAIRERVNDREIAECEAAAKFFAVSFEDVPDEAAIAALEERVNQYKLRAQSNAHNSEMFEHYTKRVEVEQAKLRALIAKRDQMASQPRFALLPDPEAAPPPVKAPDLAAAKMPRIRDIVLEQLRVAMPDGQKVGPIKKYIETTYSTQLHEKTVGMTLYRLSKDNLVHRKGQIWFYAPQAGQVPTADAENPGDDTPGPTHVAELGKEVA